jgi:hypothetical protein
MFHTWPPAWGDYLGEEVVQGQRQVFEHVEPHKYQEALTHRLLTVFGPRRRCLQRASRSPELPPKYT